MLNDGYFLAYENAFKQLSESGLGLHEVIALKSYTSLEYSNLNILLRGNKISLPNNSSLAIMIQRLLLTLVAASMALNKLPNIGMDEKVY
jgi:hypothetical protein